MERIIREQAKAHELVQKHGSPLHIVVTSEFRRNVADLLQPIQQRGLTGGLFFARKANKLPWFVSAAKEAGIGVDTASITEVRETLELGVEPAKIIVTAVGKERDLVTLAIDKGCLLVIDNFDEMQLVEQVAQSAGKKARVGLRFAGFETAERKIFSRFGLPVADAGPVLERAARNKQFLSLEILHAHLDRYDTAERACAAFQLAEITGRAQELGLTISGIDLGGGILIRYLQDEAQWQDFQKALIDSVRGDRPAFTFQSDGLGYYRVGHEVHGNADLYPAYNKLSKERFVAAVLDYKGGEQPLYKELAGRNLSVYFEPGRALLDNTGITLARVTFRKLDTLGHQLVGLAMNRMNLRPFRAEFCCDPVILPVGKSEGGAADHIAVASDGTTTLQGASFAGAFLVGSLCSESDLIYRRKLNLQALPAVQDLVLFPNSAGYLMHHMEIGIHGDPLPTNVLVDPETLNVTHTFGNRG